MGPKSRIMVSGVMDITTKSTKHKNEELSGFGKVKVTSYSSNMKQNIPTELLAFPVFFYLL